MFFVYPAVFHKEETGYWVDFPDLKGCQTFGSTLEETVEYAQEALSGYLMVLLERQEGLAAPSDISSIRAGEGEFVSLVSCKIDQYKAAKAVKKTLTIPAWLNDMASARGLNFSKILQDALINRIQGIKR